MCIELTDFRKLHTQYCPLRVLEIESTDGESISKCLSIVKEWRNNIVGVKKTIISQVEQDYISIANGVVFILTEILKGEITPDQKLLVAFSKEGDLEGVAIVEKKSSRKKKSPFMEVSFLLTAEKNVSSNTKKTGQKVKGVGCALLAKAIKLQDKGKCLYLSSTSSAESFYEKIDFIPAYRQIPGSYKNYKLPAKNFGGFILKRAINVSFA